MLSLKEEEVPADRLCPDKILEPRCFVVVSASGIPVRDGFASAAIMAPRVSFILCPAVTNVQPPAIEPPQVETRIESEAVEEPGRAGPRRPSRNRGDVKFAREAATVSMQPRRRFESERQSDIAMIQQTAILPRQDREVMVRATG